MPTIPDVSRLKRAIPEDMTTVTRVDTSDVGRGTEALGRAFKDIADDRDEYELNKAEANYLIAKTKEDNAYKDDEDYATIPQRYEENTSKLMSDISAKITNPRVREQFLLRQRQNQAVGIERIKALASDKERDFERGEILNIENDLFDVGVQGNIVEAVKQYERVLDSGHKYISKEEKAKRVESFKERASTAWIKSKEPEQQLELLKSPGAKHLPADVKIELKKKAKEKLREHKAIDIVDDIRNRDLPPGDAFNEVRQKYQDDPELRQDIEARLEYEFTVDRNSEIDAQRTIFQDVYLPVRQGKDINDPEIQAAMRVMTPDQVRSMYNAAAAAAGGGSRGTAKTSPRWLVNELNRLHAQGAHDEVSALFLEDNNFEKLSTSDFNVWSKNTAEGLVDPEAKSINNDHRAIQQRMDIANDKSEERKAILTREYDEWRRRYIERKGEEPTDKQREEILDTMMIRFDPGYLTFEKPLFMLSPDQQEQFKRELQEKDDKIWIKNLVGIEDDTLYDDVVAGFERMGYEPTLPEFVQKYNQLKELRSATK